MSLVNEWKNDYYDLWLNIKFEFLKSFKQKRLIVISLLSLAMPTLFYLVVKARGRELPSDVNQFISSLMNFVAFVIALNAIIFGADAINTERHNKTALLIFPLPQRRTSIFIGKYITELIISWFVTSLYYGAIAIIVIINYGVGSLPIEMLKSLFFAFIYMTALLSGAFFLSSIIRSPALSMAMTFLGVFMLVPILSLILGAVDINTDWIITNYSGFITSVYRFSSNFGPTTSSSLTIENGILLGVIYSLVFGIMAWYVNNVKEI